MIQVKRNNGQNYADNILNRVLYFDALQTWNITGTGTAILDNTVVFSGNSSLKLDNTDPTINLVASNSDQDTIIKVNGSYQFSCYLRKNDALEVYTGKIEIFKNAILLDTQTFSLGGDNTDEYENKDYNDEWVRFVSDQNYSLLKSDVITFRLTLDGISGYVGSNTSLWFDGMMLNLADRVNFMPPAYTIPSEISEIEILENRIIVNQLNVLTTLGGTIDSTKQYFIDGSINMTGVTITVPNTGIFIAGLNLDLSQLSCADNNYTMFSGGSSGNVFLQDLSLEVTGTSSQVFDLTDATGFNAIELVRINFNNCTAIGEINGYRQGLETNTGRFGGTPEMTLSGTWLGGYFIDTSIVRGLTDGGYSLFKAGTAFTMNSRFRTNQNVDLPASASYLNFAPSNFVNPSTLQVTGALVSRNGTFNSTDSNITPNITQADLESAWSNNIGMSNTFEGGRLVVSSENLTNILAGSTWYTLNAIWSATNLEHFDNPSGGQLRHLGNSPREYKCNVNFVIESQPNNDIGIRLRKWDNSAGSFVDFGEKRREINSLTGGRDVAFFNFSFNVALDQNDYVFFQVRNNSGNNNLTLELDSDFILEER
ncbi:MAG: hypothetical protein HRU26_05675 [Psychroserpens sp.]|nr:hypothetical protein [Psychroserpens sp.]